MKAGPLFAAGGGILLLWSGLTGRSWSTVLKDLISGKTPTKTAPTNTILGGSYGYGVGSAGAAPIVKGIFTNTQLQQLWISVGGNPAKAALAACIADHESSGNPQAESANPDGGSNVGLWQLDTKGVGAGLSVAQLKNPLVNARRTVQGSRNGTDWSQWATASSCGA